MRSYKQLNYEERVKIAELKQSGRSTSQIALEINRPRSTIWRELRRNEGPPKQYWPDTAQAKTIARRLRGCILDHNLELKEFIMEKLCCHFWTPEQIAGYLKNAQSFLPSVSHETIYQWIYKGPQKKQKLWKFLPRHKAKRGLRKSKGAGVSRIPERISIHARPKIVQGKKDFGHWEADLMSFQKNSQHILVLRERKTMFTCSIPLENKRSDTTTKAIVDLLKSFPKRALKTLTFDNGGEFAGHKQVSNALNLKTFFCDPYASWQKGGIENTNGRLRRDLPRNTNIKSMNKEEFHEILENYNSTPRKNLAWLTPSQLFYANLSRVALRA